jgi:hypothetical protein
MTLSKAERIELLLGESRQCRVSDKIVDWAASLWTTAVRQLLVTADGDSCMQKLHFVVPGLHVTAFDRGVSQTRSWGGRYNGFCRQGDLEVLEDRGFTGAGRAPPRRLHSSAPSCPAGFWTWS